MAIGNCYVRLLLGVFFTLHSLHLVVIPWETGMSKGFLIAWCIFGISGPGQSTVAMLVEPKKVPNYHVSNNFPMKTRDFCYINFADKSVSMQPFGLPC